LTRHAVPAGSTSATDPGRTPPAGSHGPNLEVVGWYDHAHGNLRLQQTLVKEGKTKQARKGSRLVIGPWSHFPPGGRKFGNIDFGPAADVNLEKLDVRWFDYWLKGTNNGDRDAW
jgi:predicted acyl esterase